MTKREASKPRVEDFFKCTKSVAFDGKPYEMLFWKVWRRGKNCVDRKRGDTVDFAASHQQSLNTRP